MDNLPKDPPDQNGGNNNNNPTPPPFGSSFNPHTNPVDPNNPYSSQPSPTPQNSVPEIPKNPDSSKHATYSEVAEHKERDVHGRFIHSEHTVSPNFPNPPNIPTPSNPPPPAQTPLNSSPSPGWLPPIIEINQNTKPTDKKDPPLFGFFLTNPVTYLRAFLSKLLKRQMITLRIPVLALIIIMAGVGGGLGGFGIGFKSGINYGLGKLFPTFSPLLHRSITAQGIIQKSSGGYYLQANDKNKTMWTLNPVSQNVNLADYVDQKVQIKGNLTPTPNLIEVSEVISFDAKPTPTPALPTGEPASPNSPNNPNLPNIPNQDLLPKLYSGLTWEVTQRKVLLFTSGKRRIEQEGVYLESSQVTNLPQDFIDYYTNQLTTLGFKQTLNSTDPDGTMITYSKDELFLTFGIKNIYSGSGDNKKIVGYKAYLEHN